MKTHLLSFACLCLLFTACTTSTIPTNPVPDLNDKGDGKGNPYKGEGPTDWEIYKPALGKKKVLMLYVDFPNAKQDSNTRDWGNKGERDRKFADLFKTQSYGKMEMRFEYVHDWRTLPKDHTEYGTKTTEAHRALFVDVFALYPELNLFEYDYIIANMSRLGNVAFGERDEIAIPYKDGKIRLAVNLGSQSHLVFAHEVGHVMGLPDLYTYGGVDGPKNPLGPWDVMSEADGSTGFIGWHRHKFGWLDAGRKTYLASGTHELVLVPLSARKGLSMAVVPVDDKHRPSKVFVIEPARGIRVKKELLEQGGVLIYSVDATIVNGNNQLVVYPKTDKTTAPFHPGDTFEHDDAPMKVTVKEKLANGNYRVVIKVK